MKNRKGLQLLIVLVALVMATAQVWAQGTPQHQQEIMQQRMKQVQQMSQWVTQFQDRVHHINQTIDQPAQPGNLAHGTKADTYAHMVQINQHMGQMGDQMKNILDEYAAWLKQAEDTKDPAMLEQMDHFRDKLAELTTAFDGAQKTFEGVVNQNKKMTSGG